MGKQKEFKELNKDKQKEPLKIEKKIRSDWKEQKIRLSPEQRKEIKENLLQNPSLKQQYMDKYSVSKSTINRVVKESDNVNKKDPGRQRYLKIEDIYNILKNDQTIDLSKIQTDIKFSSKMQKILQKWYDKTYENKKKLNNFMCEKYIIEKKKDLIEYMAKLSQQSASCSSQNQSTKFNEINKQELSIISNNLSTQDSFLQPTDQQSNDILSNSYDEQLQQQSKQRLELFSPLSNRTQTMQSTPLIYQKEKLIQQPFDQQQESNELTESQYYSSNSLSPSSPMYNPDYQQQQQPRSISLADQRSISPSSSMMCNEDQYQYQEQQRSMSFVDQRSISPSSSMMCNQDEYQYQQQPRSTSLADQRSISPSSSMMCNEDQYQYQQYSRSVSPVDSRSLSLDDSRMISSGSSQLQTNQSLYEQQGEVFIDEESNRIQQQNRQILNESLSLQDNTLQQQQIVQYPPQSPNQTNSSDQFNLNVVHHQSSQLRWETNDSYHDFNHFHQDELNQQNSALENNSNHYYENDQNQDNNNNQNYYFSNRNMNVYSNQYHYNNQNNSVPDVAVTDANIADVAVDVADTARVVVSDSAITAIAHGAVVTDVIDSSLDAVSVENSFMNQTENIEMENENDCSQDQNNINLFDCLNVDYLNNNFDEQDFIDTFNQAFYFANDPNYQAELIDMLKDSYPLALNNY